MMHAEELHRGPGRPRKIVPEPVIASRMASALMIYQIDLGNMQLVHRALWRSGFRYQDAMAHADEAIAVAKARASRRQ